MSTGDAGAAGLDARDGTTVATALHRRRYLALGGVGVILALGLGAVLWVRGNGPLAIDDDWMRDLAAIRGPVLTVLSDAMNFIGGGWFSIFVVPLGVGAVFFLFGRRWAALVFIVASAASAGLVQLLKTLFGRARPEDILVAVDPGSFPSGHTANAATIAIVLGLLLSRWWVWAAGALWVVAMALSRTYLGAHWLSDTIGGALLGAGVGLLVWVAFSVKEMPERQRRLAG
jgi:undecaprenyl-diphosphatase